MEGKHIGGVLSAGAANWDIKHVCAFLHWLNGPSNGFFDKKIDQFYPFLIFKRINNIHENIKTSDYNTFNLRNTLC